MNRDRPSFTDFAVYLAFALFAWVVLASPARGGSLIGVNSERPVPYSPACPTIDAMRTAEPKAGGYVWQDNGVDMRGAYTLIRPDGTRSNIQAPAGPFRFTADPGSKLLRPGYTSDAGTFTREYLASKEPFGVVRLMNWMAANDVQDVTDWASRPKPSDPFWSNPRKGAPVEPWIEWARTTGKPLWFCIPHTATDDYVRGLAQACAAAGITCYVEHSNEVWNYRTVAGGYTGGGGDGGVPAKAKRAGLPLMTYHLKRTLQIGTIFRQHMPASRVRVVFAAKFSGGLYDVNQALNTLKPPAGEMYAIAVAPYMTDAGGALTTNPQDHANFYLARAKNWLAGTNSASVASMPAWAKACKAWGAKLVAYEANLDPTLGGTAAQIAARKAAMDLPQTAEALAIYLDALIKHGFTEVVIYKDFSLWNGSGYYGLSNHPRKLDGPRYRAVIAAAAKYQDGNPAPPPVTQPVPSPVTQPDPNAAKRSRLVEIAGMVAALEAEAVRIRGEIGQ